MVVLGWKGKWRENGEGVKGEKKGEDKGEGSRVEKRRRIRSKGGKKGNN